MCDRDLIVQSSMTYKKIGRRLEELYGVPAVRNQGGALIEDLLQQVAAVIRERGRDAAIAGARSAYAAFADHLPQPNDDGFFIPPVTLRIDHDGIGEISVGGYNTVARVFRIRQPRLVA